MTSVQDSASGSIWWELLKIQGLPPAITELVGNHNFSVLKGDFGLDNSGKVRNSYISWIYEQARKILSDQASPGKLHTNSVVLEMDAVLRLRQIFFMPRCNQALD